MTTFVLIIMINMYADRPAVTFGYFHSLDACNKAANKIIEVDKSSRYPNHTQVQLAMCMEDK